MRIALLVTGLNMGGAENQVVNLVDRFLALGHQVLLIALTGDAAVLPKNPEVQLARLQMAKTPAGFLAGYRRARRLLREFFPDVVHSHMVHANVFSRLLRLTTAMPRLICTAHSSNEGGALRMWAYRLTDSLADMTTNVSHDAVMSYIRCGAVLPRKIMAMRNGIDCEKFRFDAASRAEVRHALGLEQDTPVLLAVGRFTEAKDYSNLLTAFSTVSTRRGDCILLIAGGGKEQSRYEAQARHLNIAEKVRFLGVRRDIPALMSAADIFVLSSAWEGLPLVVGEALACERVIVSTDAGGIREWLGGIGHVVPTKNSPALAAAILQSLELTAAEKNRQGQAGREYVLKHYSLEAVAAHWLEIYQGKFVEHSAGSPTGVTRAVHS